MVLCYLRTFGGLNGSLFASPVAAALSPDDQWRVPMRARLHHAFPWFPPTALRMFGSGSWRVRGRASTSHTGKCHNAARTAEDLSHIPYLTPHSIFSPLHFVSAAFKASRSPVLLTPRPCLLGPTPGEELAPAMAVTSVAITQVILSSRIQLCHPYPLPIHWHSLRRRVAD